MADHKKMPELSPTGCAATIVILVMILVVFAVSALFGWFHSLRETDDRESSYSYSLSRPSYSQSSSSRACPSSSGTSRSSFTPPASYSRSRSSSSLPSIPQLSSSEPASSASSNSRSSSSGEESYPYDPYNVYEYQDPDLFWWDYGIFFDDYDECSDYFERAWGDLLTD